MSHKKYGSPLLIGMMALAGLLSGERLASVPDIILRHERPYWSAVADRFRLPIHPRDQRKAVAAFSLCGAANEAEALELLAKLPGLMDRPDEAHERRQRAASWLRALLVLSRSASHQPDMTSVLVELLGRQPHLAACARTVLPLLENPGPLLLALRERDSTGTG